MINNTIIAFGNVYAGKTVLITGDTGFKGSWLCSWLLELGATVHGLAHEIPTQPALYEVDELEKRITHHHCDIRDLTSLKSVFETVKPDFLFHLAAQPIVIASYLNPVETMQTNIMGTVHVLECLRECTFDCAAVMITSDKCYDNVEWIWGYKETDALGGKDPYSASKGAAELMIKTYFHSWFSKPDSPVRIGVARAGNVIGGGDWAANRIVPDCMRSWAQHQSVEIRSPHATRPWQHVLEPLSGYLALGQYLAASRELHGEAFNFGPNADQNKTVLELLKALAHHWQFTDPEAAFEITQQHSTRHEAGLLKLNCDKALAYLGWTPTLHFEETAELTASWYYAFYHQKASSSDSMATLTSAHIHEYCNLALQRGKNWIRQKF